MIKILLRSPSFLLLASITLLCCKQKSVHEKIEEDRTAGKRSAILKRIEIKNLESDISYLDFSLVLSTKLSTDTLDIEEAELNSYSSPIILDQGLSFFSGGKLLKQYPLTMKKKKLQTKTSGRLNAIIAPIYKICVIKVGSDAFYQISGSDYCMGSNCPEFLGIYTTNGVPLYEGLTTEIDSKVLTSVIDKYKFEINAPVLCKDVNFR